MPLFFQAVRSSIYGRPGVSYIDIPGDMVHGTTKDTIRCWWASNIFEYLFPFFFCSCLQATRVTSE